jgi:hypothetical protein
MNKKTKLKTTKLSEVRLTLNMGGSIYCCEIVDPETGEVTYEYHLLDIFQNVMKRIPGSQILKLLPILYKKGPTLNYDR